MRQFGRWLGLTLVWARHGGTFVENKGQIFAEVRYEAAWGPHRIYLTQTGVALLLVDDTPMRRAHFDRWGLPQSVTAHFLRIQWVGANFVEPIGEKPELTYYNFFQGPWRATDVRGFHEVWYREVYPGVTARFQLTPTGLKWDWLVESPSALAAIRLRYEGVSISAQGDSLLIETAIGTFSERLPRVYLARTGEAIPARYRIEGSTVRYELLSEVQGPLVVDPVVVFSTYSGSYSDNWGFTATYDLQGNAFAGGNVNDNLWNSTRSNPLPCDAGSSTGDFGGGVSYASNQPIFWATDIALWKTNPTGTARLWATYFGGSNNEQPHSLITDPQGNLYFMGATRSTDYPVSSTAYQLPTGGVLIS